MVDARIREETGSLVPQDPGPWAERVPDIEDPARREYVAPSPPRWTSGPSASASSPPRRRRCGPAVSGPVPDDPLDRLEWQERAAKVASYREMYGYDDPGEPIGPEPVNSPEARAAWHAAFAALGPVDGVDLRKETDGRLLNLRASYEAETAWAPRFVGDELRQVRLGADDMGRDAVLADARAKAARGTRRRGHGGAP